MGVKLLSVKLIYVWFLDAAEPERNTKKTLINWDNGEFTGAMPASWYTSYAVTVI